MNKVMIEEDYVSFETAKLLKEKGFDAPCFAFYYVMPHKTVIAYDTNFPKNSDLCLIYANMEFGSLPTLQMAMKWLREVYNIHIVIHPYTEMEGHNWSFIFDKFAYGCWQELGIYITDSWNTYEQACEAAIKYCLENLI